VELRVRRNARCGGVIVACTSALAMVVLFACSSDDGDTPERMTVPVGTDAAAADGADGAIKPRREAGVPMKCAAYAGSTSSDTCSCGETEAPYSGMATDKCPINDSPHYCVSYDVVDPPPLRRECTCQPKCLFQQLAASGDAGTIDTCRCGVTSHLVLGGNGSKDEARPTCDGYAVCCKGPSGCDCTSDATYACPSDTTMVASCTPADFNDKIWKAVVYGSPSFTDLLDVERCR
jgi:hypothetical protein